MYDLNAFRERIAALYHHTSPYDDGRRPTQKDLADAIGLNRSELSSRLNGLKQARLSVRDVKAIVQTLAEWGAITTQGEAQELLALIECPDFSAAEWQAQPLIDLTPSSAVLTKPSPIHHSSLITHPSTLPRPLTSFIGREQERVEIAQQISQCRLVTLSGMGGVGKTRLALEVASQLADRFRDGVYFVELASLHDTALAPAAIGRAMGIEEHYLWGASELIREQINVPIFPTNRDFYEQYAATARASLGDVAFDLAWQAGRRMEQQTAIAYALSENHSAPPPQPVYP